MAPRAVTVGWAVGATVAETAAAAKEVGRAAGLGEADWAAAARVAEARAAGLAEAG